MKIETLSVFPQMFDQVMSLSIIERACRAQILEFAAHDLRKWTHDNHNTTDDEPYGGGAGQLMKVEPVFEALDELCSAAPPPHVVFFTPAGRRFDQKLAEELSQKQHLIMVCGRYEGFDERVYSRADLCLSLGDYVLTGGELAAMVVIDAVCRLLPGALGDEHSSVDESFSAHSHGLLEYPQYTRPAEYRGLGVPEVLLSGHHQKIAQWRREQSIIRTAQLRPDLLEHAELDPQERQLAVTYLDENDLRKGSFAPGVEILDDNVSGSGH